MVSFLASSRFISSVPYFTVLRRTEVCLRQNSSKYRKKGKTVLEISDQSIDLRNRVICCI